MRYYFALLSLPPLSFNSKPDISFNELKDFLQLNLSSGDFRKFISLLWPIDLYNIRALWLGQPLDDNGSFGVKELEEVLLVQDNLPDYLVEFLDRYEATADRLSHFSSLYASLFRELEPCSQGFLRAYFRFERELTLFLTALRAKQIKRDIVRELQFEDPTDPLIAYIFAQKDAPDFVPPQEFEKLKTLFEENSREPEKLNRSILEYRFERVEEMEQNLSSFSIDQVLGYVVRFLIIDGWYRLDKEKGNLIVEELSEY